jgi:hypothetical protein
VRLPRIWRNEIGFDSDRPPVFWPLGAPTWRALVRTAPLGPPLFLGVVPGYPLDNTGASGPVVDAVVAVSVIVGCLVLAVLAPAVALFARPKRLIAPHLRHQCGLIAAWRGQRPRRTPPPDVQPGIPLRR